MRRRTTRRRRVRHPERATPEIDRLGDHVEGALRIVQGQEPHPDEPWVVSAERRHHPVVGAPPSANGIEIVGERDEPAGEGQERKLGGKTEQVERGGSFGGGIRLEGGPTLSSAERRAGKKRGS